MVWELWNNLSSYVFCLLWLIGYFFFMKGNSTKYETSNHTRETRDWTTYCLFCLITISIVVGQTLVAKGYSIINDYKDTDYIARNDDNIVDTCNNEKKSRLHNDEIAKNFQDEVRFLFPKTITSSEWQDSSIVRQGDCEIIIMPSGKTLMIDASTTYQYTYLMSYLRAKGITKIDYFLLTHYHGDHYGNIYDFINNQSIVDFRTTKWFIPHVANVPVSETNAYLTVQGWLTSAGADVTVLNSDRSIQLDKSVRIDLFNCSDEARKYHDEHSTIGRADWNSYSVQALIYHHDVVAYYTGDLWADGIDYVVNNYELPNVDLLKINHHGLFVGADTDGRLSSFMRKLSPKYSLYNGAKVGWYYDANNLIDLACQYGETYQILDDAEFISDGKTIRKISDNHWRANALSKAANYIYIDCNYNFSRGIPDGTKERPFPSFMQAKAFIGNGLSRFTRVFFAAGSYGNLSLQDIPRTINLVFSPNNDTNFDDIVINNCNLVIFRNNLNCKSLQVSFSTVSSTGSACMSPVSKKISIVNSDVSFDRATVTVDGKNASFTGDNLIAIYKSNIFMYGLSLKNCTKDYAVYVNQGATLNINTFAISNLTGKYIFAGFGTGSSINLGSTSGVSAGLSIANSNDLKFVSSPASRTLLGTAMQRPDLRYLPSGFQYYDTTLKHMLIVNDGVWIDLTTGNVP